MRTLYLLSSIFIALFISACASTSDTPPSAGTQDSSDMITPPKCHHHHDALQVSFLTYEKPSHPYQVVGQLKVSQYNAVGVKRQAATVHDIMRELAASLDGDAIINIKHDDKMVTATVVSYKKILI